MVFYCVLSNDNSRITLQTDWPLLLSSKIYSSKLRKQPKIHMVTIGIVSHQRKEEILRVSVENKLQSVFRY